MQVSVLPVRLLYTCINTERSLSNKIEATTHLHIHFHEFSPVSVCTAVVELQAEILHLFSVNFFVMHLIFLIFLIFC